MNDIQIAHIEYSINTKSLDVFNIGCNGTCRGCYNNELKDWNLKGMSVEHTLSKLINLNNKFDKLIDKIILVGGDPVDGWCNKNSLDVLLTEIRNSINKPIFLFTRHELEYIPKQLQNLVDYIKTGAYIPELTVDDNIQYGIKLATSNQKIYKKENDKWV